MSISRDELLQPSIGETAVAKAPYTTLTAFLTAFIGGPFAIIALTALNSFRVLRLKRDLIFLIPALALSLVLAPALGLAGGLLPLRLFALVLFGFGFLLHKREHRTADLMGIKRPNGWIGGLACIITGNAIFFAYVFLISSLAKA